MLCAAHNDICCAFTGLEGSWSVYTCTPADPWVMRLTAMFQRLLMVDFLSLWQACLRKPLKERAVLWVQVPELLVCDHLVLCCFGWWWSKTPAEAKLLTLQWAWGREEEKGDRDSIFQRHIPQYFPNQAPYPKGPLDDKFINGILEIFSETHHSQIIAAMMELMQWRYL